MFTTRSKINLTDAYHVKEMHLHIFRSILSRALQSATKRQHH